MFCYVSARFVLIHGEVYDNSGLKDSKVVRHGIKSPALPVLSSWKSVSGAHQL